MRDSLSNTRLTRAANQTLSGTTANASDLFDRRGFGSLTVYLETGTVTDAGTASGFTMKLQHSDTTATGDFVDVGDSEVVPNSGGLRTITVTSDADDNLFINGLGYVGEKRYVRGLTTGTTGTSAVINLVGIFGHPSQAPTTTIVAPTAST
jgi:hypothetical protein